MSDIRESDWKIARSMKEKALDLACKQILEKASKIVESDDEGNHAKYLELWSLLRAEDKRIRLMFDDFKRGGALQQISFWKRHGLITDEEFSSFSPETQERIEAMLEIWG